MSNEKGKVYPLGSDRGRTMICEAVERLLKRQTTLTEAYKEITKLTDQVWQHGYETGRQDERDIWIDSYRRVE